MTGALAQLFTTAIELTGRERMLLLLPLCLSIAIVYKTTRCENPREAARATLVLWGTIVVGMYVVGVGLWAVFTIMV